MTGYTFSQKVKHEFTHLPEVLEFLKDKHHRATYIHKEWLEDVLIKSIIFTTPLTEVCTTTVPAFVIYDELTALEFYLKFSDYFDQEPNSEELEMREPTQEELEILKLIGAAEIVTWKRIK
jgi:hypothetical protein